MTIFAASNRSLIRYVVESLSAWGVVPASGVSRLLRYTGSTLNLKKGTTESNEIRADRMVSSIVETEASADGDFKFEMSAGSQDDFVEAFLMGTWSRPLTFDMFEGDVLSWANQSTLYLAGTDASAIYSIGRVIKTTGFLASANNGYHQITAIDYNAAFGRTEITVNTTSAYPEVGSAYARLYDANDVMILSNAAIRSGTGGSSTFDSNGTNAFASLITAGQLSLGQNIFFEGLGFGNGSIALSANPVAGDSITLSDGVSLPVTLVANTNYVIGATVAATIGNIEAAINLLRAAETLSIDSTVSGSTIELRNLNGGGGSIVAHGAGFTVTQFTGGDATQRGLFTITSLQPDVIGVLPQPGTNANGNLGVTVKGSMLRNPSDPNAIVARSFSLSTTFSDVEQTLMASGMRVSGWDLDISASKIATGTFAFMGREQTPVADDLFASAPFVALPTTTTESLNGTTDVGQITSNGEVLASAVMQITLKGNANLRLQQALSSKYPVGIGTGRFTLTGDLTAYFNDFTLYNQFVSHATLSLGFSMIDLDKNTYVYTIPTIKITSDPVEPEGIDTDVMEKMNWMAFRDPVTQCMVQIDRFSSNSPI